MMNSDGRHAVGTGDAKSNHQRSLAWLMGFLLIAGTLACYWPVQHYDYVSLDDPLYVSQTRMVQRGLTWEGVKWAFQSVKGGNWNPLVWLSQMADCQIYGRGAGGHHVTNVILHTANVVLLFVVLRAMTGTLWQSGLAAALFGWHPLHVESVAWISERKDVLSTLFWLLTMWGYGWYAREVRKTRVKCWIYYGLALLFFVLGLMSKAMLVTLPVVMLVLDFWPLRRIYHLRLTIDESSECEQPGQDAEPRPGTVSLARAVVEKLPFLVLSVAASVGAMWAQKNQGAMGEERLWLRLENAAVSCVTYLGEFFWPVKLAVFYPYPERIALWRAMAAAGLLVLITLVVVWLAKARPYFAAGWLWFVVTLLPVIGLVQVGMQAQADRYTYVPYIGLGLMVSWGLAELSGFGPRWRMAAVLAAAAGLAGSAAATRAQLKYWQNSAALYERALAVTSGNYIAHDNLGNLLEDQGKLDQAAKEFKEVIRLTPKIGKPYNDLGKVYALQGKLEEATEMFSNAVRLNPGLAQARWNLGNAWLQKGRVAAGLAEMKAGVALSPEDVEAHRKMADTLIKLGKAAEAIPYCEMVVKAEPKDARAHFVLGEAYLEQKQSEEAKANFKEAVRLAPETPQALNALAWVYATSSRADIRNGPEAVRLAEKACELTKRQDPEMLDTLGAAYAEAGRFEDAMKAATAARILAESSHDAKEAEMEREREKLYRAGRPYHEEP